MTCLRQLEKQSISAPQLKSSGLGMELNNKFWRKHYIEDIATRSRKLLDSWKSVVAQRKLGYTDTLAKEQEMAAKRKREESKASASSHGSAPALSKDAAAAATRVAKAVEVAAWSKFCGAAVHLGVVDEGSEGVRAYKGRVRLIGATFRRPENADLRKRALEGRVSGGDLVDCTEEELLSAERRTENTKLREEALKSILVDKVELDLYDEHLECPQCGKTGAKYAVVCDTGVVPMDGSSGHKRQKTKKRIHAQCSSCGERW